MKHSEVLCPPILGKRNPRPDSKTETKRYIRGLETQLLAFTNECIRLTGLLRVAETERRDAVATNAELRQDIRNLKARATSYDNLYRLL